MTVVDLRSHLTAPVPGTGRRPRTGPDRRSATPVARLGREHDACCVAAVDPLEIAADLEASGVTDTACRRLGYADVFAVADELFRSVPRRGAGSATALTRPVVSVHRCALRGLIYALPGLAGVGLGVHGPRAALVMLVALTTGWAWSNAMAHVGHRRLGWEGRPAARAVLRRGVGWGCGVTLLAVTGAVLAARADAGTLAAGVGLAWYMIAAGALLVLERERLLLAALVPATAGGVLLLLGVAAPVGAGLPAATVAATATAAVLATRRRVGDPPARTGDLRPALGHLLHGAVSAGVVGLGPLTLASLQGTPVAVPWFVVLPLVLGMGPMELALERLRRSTDRVLWETCSPREFARATRGALLRSVTELAPVLLLVAGACWPALVAADAASSAALVLLAGYVALAGCFFLGLVLVSTGNVAAAAAALGTGLAAYLLLATTWSPAVAFAAVLAALSCALLVTTVACLRSPLQHL